MTAIYVTEAGSELKVQHHHLLVFHHRELRYKVPINQLSQIIVFGCHLSREAASLALFRRIPILFLGTQGQYLGRSEHQSKRQPKYQPHQLKRSFDFEFTFATAQSMIRAKLHNCCIVLQRLMFIGSTLAVQTALDVMVLLIDDLPMANSIDELREYEVMAATFYYPALASLLPHSFGFKQRKNHPPTDPINSLLNLGYILLNQTIYSFVQELGLDCDFGNLHLESYHPSPLVCDFMAEFRALLVDELVASLVISQALAFDDFLLGNTCLDGYLSPQTLNTFLKYWEDKLQTQVIHPHAGKLSYRQCLELQVREYIACLLGDVEFYRPMLFKVNAAPLAVYSPDKQETEQLIPLHL